MQGAGVPLFRFAVSASTIHRRFTKSYVLRLLSKMDDLLARERARATTFLGAYNRFLSAEGDVTGSSRILIYHLLPLVSEMNVLCPSSRGSI